MKNVLRILLTFSLCQNLVRSVICAIDSSAVYKWLNI